MLEFVFLNEGNLKVIFDIFNNQEFIRIPDILNLYVLFIHIILRDETKIKFAKAFKKAGLVDSIINILELDKIKIDVLSNAIELASSIIQYKFEVFDLKQVS